jgi:sugar transferase (PEP-CTERM/EpsH1 system associated)
MRVHFLSQIVPYPPHGGVLQRGYNLLRELGKHAEVHLLAFVHPDELRTPERIQESREALRQFCARVDYFPLWPKKSAAHRVAALAAGAVSSSPFSVVAHRSSAYRDAVNAACRAAAPDILHVDTIALAQFVGPAHAGIPAVLTHHNIESVLMARRAAVEARPAARWYLEREARKLRQYEIETAPAFATNIVVSPNDGRILSDMVPGVRTDVVPNGVDVEYFTPDWDQATPSLIYTGGMNMFANRDAVLYFLEEIWPLVRAQEPGTRFFAVGQDPPSELLAIAKRDPNVIVTGFVDDIRSFVKQASVYVVPIRVGGGTRLKVLDAMASGKALVSTSIGCEGIVATPGRDLVVADTPADFATATVGLLRDPARRRTLGEAARALVEQHYAWPVIGDRLMAVYRAAIETGARA